MAPYCTAEQIGDYLGVTFTPEQEAQAAAMAQAVSNVIDRYVGTSWQGTSPVSGELANVLPGSSRWPGSYGIVYLEHRPATAISAVSIRTARPLATDTLLEIDQYELVDPTNGVLTLTGGAYYPETLAVVDYTYSDAVPADITLAATMIAAGQMSAILAIQRGSGVITNNPELAGLEQISVGQNDVSVRLASTVTGGAAAKSSAEGSSWIAPGSAVALILDGYRRPVIA